MLLLASRRLLVASDKIAKGVTRVGHRTFSKTLTDRAASSDAKLYEKEYLYLFNLMYINFFRVQNPCPSTEKTFT